MVYFILALKAFFFVCVSCFSFVFWSTQTKNVIACATRNWSFFSRYEFTDAPYAPPSPPTFVETRLIWYGEPVLPWEMEYFCCGNLFCCGTRFAKGTYFATGTCLQKGPVSQPLQKVPILLWKFVCFCYGINMTIFILLRREPDQFSLLFYFAM